MAVATKADDGYPDPRQYRAPLAQQLINDVRRAQAEEMEHLAAFEERADEPLVAFETILKELKRDGRL